MTPAATAAASALFVLGAVLLLLGVVVKRGDERRCDFANTTHEGGGDE